VRVDFYLLSKDTVEAALPRIAKSVKGAGERMLVVAAEPDHLAMLDRALWEQMPEELLAHGKAGEAHAARQPFLLSSSCDPENGAKYIALGTWRDEALGFERTFLFFDQRKIDEARGTWRMLGEREDVERRFWKQEGGRWIEGP
jgi:DNA polymerase-3 subunit chi